MLPPTLLPAIIGHPSLHLCIMVAQILPPFDEMPEWQLKAMFWIFLVRCQERGAEWQRWGEGSEAAPDRFHKVLSNGTRFGAQEQDCGVKGASRLTICAPPLPPSPLQGANFITPSALSRFQRRLCFYTGDRPPPFLSAADELTCTCVPLTCGNARQVRVCVPTTCSAGVGGPCGSPAPVSRSHAAALARRACVFPTHTLGGCTCVTCACLIPDASGRSPCSSPFIMLPFDFSFM